MKWVKRFAAGALAAALSLALLCGCSGSSIDKGTVIDYEESVTSYMTMESWMMGPRSYMNARMYPAEQNSMLKQ